MADLNARNPGSGPGRGSSKEKRNFIRTDISVPLSLQYRDDTGAIREISAVSGNISATGLMAQLHEKPPMGKEFSVFMKIPDAPNSVHCIGKIAWSVALAKEGGFHCGIEIVKIEEDNKNTFLKFLCDTIYRLGADDR